MSTLPVTNRAFWTIAPGRGEIRSAPLVHPPPDSIMIRTLATAISPGTERLVAHGLVPSACEDAMKVPGMAGSFRLPIKYGYCLVGEALPGGRVFTMWPHEEFATVRPSDFVPLPESIPTRRALLFPNLETGVNAVWDAELAGTEEVVIVGGGLVGILVAFAVKTISGVHPVVLERDPHRRVRLASLPWVREVRAETPQPPGSFQVAFHTSGTGPGLQTAIDAVGFEGRIIDLSWYGRRPVMLDLGTSFHHQRKQLVASQVSAIAKPMRLTISKNERTAKVLDLLKDAALDALLGDATPFDNAPSLMASVFAGSCETLLPTLTYG